MLIHAAARLTGDTAAEVRRWTVEADDYEAGYAQVAEAVEDGWSLLSVRIER